MAQFLITYDNHPPRDYTALYQLLGAWRAVRLAQSVWLVDLATDAGVIRDYVVQALQRNDTVAVVELKHGSDWATSCVAPAATAWLAAHIWPAQIAA